MSTRLALGLALVLLALAAAQWRLRSTAESMSTLAGDRTEAAAPASDYAEPAFSEASLEDIEEPVLLMPEYVPPRIVERPRTPLDFAPSELTVELGTPIVSGAVEDGSAAAEFDGAEAPDMPNPLSQP